MPFPLVSNREGLEARTRTLQGSAAEHMFVGHTRWNVGFAWRDYAVGYPFTYVREFEHLRRRDIAARVRDIQDTRITRKLRDGDVLVMVDTKMEHGSVNQKEGTARIWMNMTVARELAEVHGESRAAAKSAYDRLAEAFICYTEHCVCTLRDITRIFLRSPGGSSQGLRNTRFALNKTEMKYFYVSAYVHSMQHVYVYLPMQVCIRVCVQCAEAAYVCVQEIWPELLADTGSGIRDDRTHAIWQDFALRPSVRRYPKPRQGTRTAGRRERSCYCCGDACNISYAGAWRKAPTF